MLNTIWHIWKFYCLCKLKNINSTSPVYDKKLWHCSTYISKSLVSFHEIFMIDHTGLKCILLENTFNTTNKGGISMKCWIPFDIFGHCTAYVKKNINSTSHAYDKMLWHCSTEVPIISFTRWFAMCCSHNASQRLRKNYRVLRNNC